jgi:DNA modification methylase
MSIDDMVRGTMALEGQGLPFIRVFNQDANQFLDSAPKEHYDGIFLDPPDNLRLRYDGFIDHRDDYINWLAKLVRTCTGHSPVIWLSYYWKHDVQLKVALRDILELREWKQIIWHFTFGQYRKNDLTNCYRPILRISKKGTKWDLDGIKIESERMKLGDKRAAGPKVPGDVWEFPRVVGNAKERRKWHVTQHPEALMERIYRMTPGTKFLDLFGGSGTSGIVCERLGYNCDLVEISKSYCDQWDQNWARVKPIP